jgi:hypothetical protein
MKAIVRFQHPFLILTIAVAVLAPSIPITRTFSLRPEFILAGMLFLWLLPKEGFAPFRNPVFKWMGLLAGLIAISIGFSTLVLGRSNSLQDLFEVAKVGVYAVVFYAAIGTRISESEFSKSIIWLQLIFLTSGVVGIFQYFNFFGINNHLTPLYLKASYANSIAGYRVVGTTSNANYFGMLMLFGVCLALASFLWAKTWRHKWLSLLTLITCIASMLLSTSRTVMAIFPLAGLFIVTRFAMKTRKEKKDLWQIGVVAAGSIGIMVLMLVLLPNSWFTRMSDLMNVFESESMQLRFGNWQEHWALYLQSPLFGFGPAKGLISLYVDNEWLLFLVRYGVPGPVLVLALGISMFRGTNQLVNGSASSDGQGFGVALQAFLLATPFFMITASIYHHQQLMGILLLIVGLGQGLRRSLEFHRECNESMIALEKA